MQWEKWKKCFCFTLLFLLLPLPLWWFHSSHGRTITPSLQISKSISQSKKAPPSSSSPSKKWQERSKEKNLQSPPLALSLATLHRLTHVATLPSLIYLPEGDKEKIYASLRRQGLPLCFPDRLLLLPDRIEQGWIRLQAPLSLKEFFRHINDFPREKTRRVVMYSGESLDDFIQTFSQQTLLSKRELFESYFRFSPYLDGGILAGYYRLPYRLSSDSALAYLTERSEALFRHLSEKYLGGYDPAQFKRYLVVASIVQRESWHHEEMPRIAAVIYNRLLRGMKLQMDATLNYGPYSHILVTPERIRNDSSHFNTYRYKGLPPEPLGSVTLDALRAALAPAKTKDLYFVRNIFGMHEFSTNYADHLAKISRIKAQRAKLKRFKRFLHPSN